MNLIRTEEWFKVAPAVQNGPDDLRSFQIGVYEFEMREVVLVSEAAYGVLRGLPEQENEGEWVMVNYPGISEYLLEAGWSKV